MIHELLKAGKKNALSTPEIMQRGNFRDSRAVTAQVAEERKQGYLILSTTHGGYYLPANRAEVEEFIESMVGRAESIFISIRAARRYLQTIEGQTEMKDFTMDDTS